MSITADDLSAKPFEVTVNGHKLQSKPVKIRHALGLAKIANVFNNLDDTTQEQLGKLDDELQAIVVELIPELKNVELDMQTSVSLLEQLLNSMEPSDSKELKKAGVTFDDPKAQTDEGGST